MHETEISPSQISASRRGFFKGVLALLIGAAAGLTPLVAGLWVYLDPLRRRSQAADYVEVASLATLPADGRPRRFPLIAQHVDAWNKQSNVPVGAVYLRRTGETDVTAFNAVCPHAGCFVRAADDGTFKCPCHDSEFAADGSVVPITGAGGKTVSPRGLDTLDVRLADGKVLVRFQNFLAATARKIPR